MWAKYKSRRASNHLPGLLAVAMSEPIISEWAVSRQVWEAKRASAVHKRVTATGSFQVKNTVVILSSNLKILE